MIKSSTLLLFCTLGFAACSDKDGDSPQPTPTTPPIPPNTAYAEVDGRTMRFPVDFCYAVINKKNALVIELNDPTSTRVGVVIEDFQKKVGKVTFPVKTTSGPYYYDYNRIFYASYQCGTATQAAEILTFDQVNKTVSGTFSGTACNGNGTTSVKITNGQFNIPYTIE